MELEDVFRNHQRAVYAYFLRVVGDRHAAEELAQETFVRACGAALKFRGDAPVASWLFGIARHVLMEASRKRLFRRDTSIEGLDPPTPKLTTIYVWIWRERSQRWASSTARRSFWLTCWVSRQPRRQVS